MQRLSATLGYGEITLSALEAPASEPRSVRGVSHGGKVISGPNNPLRRATPAGEERGRRAAPSSLNTLRPSVRAARRHPCAPCGAPDPPHDPASATPCSHVLYTPAVSEPLPCGCLTSLGDGRAVPLSSDPGKASGRNTGRKQQGHSALRAAWSKGAHGRAAGSSTRHRQSQKGVSAPQRCSRQARLAAATVIGCERAPRRCAAPGTPPGSSDTTGDTTGGTRGHWGDAPVTRVTLSSSCRPCGGARPSSRQR